MQPKSAIVIIGMHRSGTSALSRAVSFWGWVQSPDLLQPNFDNPKGFWEPKGVQLLNDEMLHAIGSRWDRPGPFVICGSDFRESRKRVMKALTRGYLHRGLATLAASYPDNQAIVLKDPRLSILWPVWDSVLRKAGFLPRYLFVHRNPLEVAASLKARNNVDLQMSLQLWLNYVLSGLQLEEAGLLSAIIDFDRLLEMPNQCLQPILAPLVSSVAAIPTLLPRLDVTAAAQLRAFVTSADRHQRNSKEQLENSVSVPTIIKRTYTLLLGWNGLSAEQRRSEISELRDWFHQFVLFSGDWVVVEQKHLELGQQPDSSIGDNLLLNADFSECAIPWRVSDGENPAKVGRDIADRWCLNDGHTAYLQIPEPCPRVSIEYAADAHSALLPVKAAQQYAFSGLFALHRCSGKIRVEFLGEAGHLVEVHEEVIPPAIGGVERGGYATINLLMSAPPSSRSAKIEFIAEEAQADSYLFFTELFFGLERDHEAGISCLRSVSAHT